MDNEKPGISDDDQSPNDPKFELQSSITQNSHHQNPDDDDEEEEEEGISNNKKSRLAHKSRFFFQYHPQISQQTTCLNAKPNLDPIYTQIIKI
jgi:hypothetical protein